MSIKYQVSSKNSWHLALDTWHFVSLHIAICYEIFCQKKHESHNLGIKYVENLIKSQNLSLYSQ